jgi:hypothetical protein
MVGERLIVVEGRVIAVMPQSCLPNSSFVGVASYLIASRSDCAGVRDPCIGAAKKGECGLLIHRGGADASLTPSDSQSLRSFAFHHC